jgi:hypothetical protein
MIIQDLDYIGTDHILLYLNLFQNTLGKIVVFFLQLRVVYLFNGYDVLSFGFCQIFTHVGLALRGRKKKTKRQENWQNLGNLCFWDNLRGKKYWEKLFNCQNIILRRKYFIMIIRLRRILFRCELRDGNRSFWISLR